MRFSRFGCLTAIALCVAPVAVSAQDNVGSNQIEESSGTTTADRVRLEADVRFLADDKLQGREAGTTGFALAAGYVAGKFGAMNLSPAGDDGTYFQEVPLVSAKLTFESSSSVIIKDADDKDVFLGGTAGVDYLTFTKYGDAEGTATGELVFVGHGFAADGYEQDDFADVDLTGKIAVTVRGVPASLNSEEKAHFSESAPERLSERGAVGAITLVTRQETGGVPFLLLAEYFQTFTFMTWVDEAGNAHQTAPLIEASTWLSPQFSKALFKDQKIKWSDVEAFQSGNRKSLPSFDMGLTASMTGHSEVETLTSNNVLAMIPGTDPAVAGEYVVVTAHLDHTGVKPTKTEGDDEIFNGAMDNASGIASMLEVARMIKDKPARRPVIFLALTAEEQGLVGSDYFARHPSFGKGAVVANINLDMPILTFPFSDVVALGAERSNMLPAVQAAAASNGITISEDPAPEESNFVRSDQYSFVRQGVPAIYLLTGWGNGGEEAEKDFVAKHYHKASDEAELIDYVQLARFTDVNYAITRNVANMDETPAWKAGEFFGRTFGGLMEPAE